MLDNLIIDKFDVVGKVQMPDGVIIREPTLAPFYDPEKFPYVIAMGAKMNTMEGNDYFILNIKQRSLQLLVKAKHMARPFCCIRVGENAFDLHFSSMEEEDDKEVYEYHHKLSFKEDVISVMKRCGKVPFTGLEDHVQLIEEKTKSDHKI